MSGRVGLKSPTRTVALSIFPLKIFRFFFCFTGFMYNHGYIVRYLIQNGFTFLGIFIVSLVSLPVLISFFLNSTFSHINIAFNQFWGEELDISLPLCL